MSNAIQAPFATYRHDSLEAAERTLNAILDVINEGTWDWDSLTGRVVRSPGWYRMLGYRVGAFGPDVFTWEQVIHPEDHPRVMRHFEQYISGESERYDIEYRCKRADGSYLWIHDQGRIVEQRADGTVARMIGAHLNIHERKLAEEELRQKNRILREGNQSLERLVQETTEQLVAKNRQLEQKIEEIERLSNTDALTGIANRNQGQNRLHQEISRCDRYRHPLSLCLFDIDHFKRINDRFGHKMGDLALQNLCRLIGNNIRDLDLLARWGGEEFLLILPNLPLARAVTATEKLRKLIASSRFHSDFRVSCSFGVTQYRPGEETADGLIQRADLLMYQAKRLGRNRVEHDLEPT